MARFFVHIRWRLALLLMVFVTGSCSIQPAQRVDPAEPLSAQRIEIKRLETVVTGLEQELSALRSRYQLVNAQLLEARANEQRQEAEIRSLQNRLTAAEQRLAGQSDAQDPSVTALRQQLASSQRALRSSRQEVAQAEARMQSVQTGYQRQLSELQDRLSQSEAEFAQALISLSGPTGAGIEPGAGVDSVAGAEGYYTSDDGEVTLRPTVVKVFYGTNRDHLKTSYWHYVSPFLLPLLLLLLLLAVPRAVHAIIRKYLHRVTINLLRVALVLGVIWFGFSATHEVAQRWQDAHELPFQYGTDRLEVNTSPGYSLGTVDVSIPPGHVKGDVETENFIYFEFRSDPAKHFVLSDIQEMGGDQFDQLLRQRVSLSPDKDLFVFVHGFHNTFEDAAFRTAQIAHDSGFKGAPVFYSWPSQGSVLGYTTDENNVNDAKQHLTGFLEQIKAESGAERIHLIAHSMGSRALTAAVQAIGLVNGERVFDEMILAAPDLDAGEFRGLAPVLTKATSRLTLYVSSKDSALAASRKVHGGKYQRAGESFPSPVTVEHVDTIDVSNITSGHSYIADSGHILDDLNNILVNSRALSTRIAIRRCVSSSVVQCENPEYHYWQLHEAITQTE